MVQSHDQMFSHSTEIGEANQRLQPRVKQWCWHIDAANALQSRRPTEESVNRFILDLVGSDEEAARSKDLLVQAAELGPECFSDASLRVMADASQGLEDTLPFYAEEGWIACGSRQIGKTRPGCQESIAGHAVRFSATPP